MAQYLYVRLLIKAENAEAAKRITLQAIIPPLDEKALSAAKVEVYWKYPELQDVIIRLPLAKQLMAELEQRLGSGWVRGADVSEPDAVLASTAGGKFSSSQIEWAHIQWVDDGSSK